MKTNLIKPIIVGVLLGVAVFWIPFVVVRLFLLFIIIGFIFRLFMWRRWRGNGGSRFAFADRIRGMSDEEYIAFKQNPGQYCREHTAKSPEQKTN